MKKIIAIISAIAIVLTVSSFFNVNGDFAPFSTDERVYETIESLESEINETVRIAETSTVNQYKSVSSALGYLVVTDYITSNGKTDVSGVFDNLLEDSKFLSDKTYITYK